MNHMFLAAFAAAVVPIAANASTIGPSQGEVSAVGPLTVVTYYVPDHHGFHVVLTASRTDGDPNSVVRFATVLGDGQAAVLSVPRAAGQSPMELVVSRKGDQLTVSGPLTN